MTLMFAYGMNTNSSSMALRAPYSKIIGVARLFGYQLDFRYHCDITPAGKYDYMEGLLWDMDDNDLASIDSFEGYPHYYTKLKVTVRVPMHSLDAENLTFQVFRDVVVYKMNMAPYELPDDYYLNTVREGYDENGISTKQIDAALDRATKLTGVIDESFYREI